MSKKERLSAARRKKAADPGQQSKSGAAKPTYVSTDKKVKEDVELTDAYGETFAVIQDVIQTEPMKSNAPSIDSYETYDIEAMTEEENVAEGSDKKSKGSGSKDACYHKVKSRYKVWPSAYASGALVKCRKKGAANWGNSTKKEETEIGEACWKGYEKKGMKTMFGKRYPNCVKKTKKESFSNWREEVGYEDKDSSKKIDEDWQKVNRKDKTDGLSQKAVNAYRKENPGSKLKTAVTKDPKKLKKGSKSAKRRLSFCPRMKGMKKKLTSAKTSRDPDSRINKALRRWNCSYEPTGTTIAEKALSKKQQRFFGIVRAAQKGTLEGEASPQIQRAATSMTKKDVKKYASTDHKGLPEKVKSEE
jgi:hypothetical protein